MTYSDKELLRECDVHTHRASGPGGQNRNKVESAVRLVHRPTGITVNAYESRSQHENKARALRRLRVALALRVRSPAPEGVPEAVAACIGRDGRLAVGRRDARYLDCASAVLDVLQAHDGRLSDAARHLGLSTGNLSRFLVADDDLMAEANRIRNAFALKPLKRG
ncbi:MAG TPA: peptide chain release factor-like protein [Dehalococcoidia bacterium]|nr:peptide chain release factor-like protein [Dehalococcoidia bacterium]